MMTTETGPTLAHVIGDEGLVALHLREGEIKLRGVDGDTARIREVNGHDLSDVFVVDADEGSLSLGPTRGIEVILGSRRLRRGFGRQSAKLEVEVPKRATLVIETETGEIVAQGLAGDQRYHSASGGVELRSVSGRITVEVVSGDVDLTTVNDTALAIRSVSGDVDVKAGTLTAFEAQTASGDLEVAGRLAGPGPFAIETVSGDALLALSGAVRVQMTTVTGDLSSDLEAAQVTEGGTRSITIGSGGPTLSVRSMSGDVHVGRPAAVDQPIAPLRRESPSPPVAPMSSAAPGQPVRAKQNGAIAAAYDDARLRILRSLERGEIDVAEAGRRLETLDAGDPDAPGAPADRRPFPDEPERVDG